MKVSVITVTYNSAKTILDTMCSVLAQTYKDIEYIIVDGLSSDGTIEIIQSLEDRFDGRLKYISEPDKGIYDAMNKGIAMATGDVVGILNSDDYFTSSDVIFKVVAEFTQYDIDAVFGDIHFIYDGQPDRVVRYYSSKAFRPFWLRFGFMPAHPSLYLKHQLYKEVGEYSTDYMIGSDFEMMVRLFKRRRIRYHYLSLDFVTMRMGGVSTRGIRSRWTLVKEDVRACKENGIYTNRLFIALKYLYKIWEYRFG